MRIVAVIYLFLFWSAAYGQVGMKNYGNLKVHANGVLATHTRVDFSAPGNPLNLTERTTETGDYIFTENSSWVLANDNNHIDGYVQYLGTDNFIFPVGDNNRFRPFVVQNVTSPVTGAYFDEDPSLAITSDATGGSYPILPSTGPFDRSILHDDLHAVSPKGYWRIESDGVHNINLTWDIQDGIDALTLSELEKLTIVGWRNNKWEPISSTLDATVIFSESDELLYTNRPVSFDEGNIRSGSFLTSNYEIIALGSLKCKRGFDPLVASIFSPTTCRSATGRVILQGLEPKGSYEISYLLNGVLRTLPIIAGIDGSFTINSLVAGNYTDFKLVDGVCSKSFTAFELIDDDGKDTDGDGITDCDEIDNGTNHLDPCDPDPLGNLDADCDNDGVANGIDCQPLIANISAERLCDDSEVQLTLEVNIEPWLASKNVSYAWYDGDPTTLPPSGDLISTEKNPRIAVLPKSNNEFFVITTVEDCPTASTAYLEVNLIDLSPTDDVIDLEYGRDTTYTFDVLSNDGLDISEIELFLIDAPANGSITINPDGTIDYTTDGNFGTITFTYAVCDPVCTEICEEVTVTLNVTSSVCDFIPTGFSPNNDGMNDNLEIPCIEGYPNSSLKIYNRWGDVVYQSDNYNNDWDGTFKGGLLPAGTYFYLLRVNKPNTEELNGYIYIQY